MASKLERLFRNARQSEDLRSEFLNSFFIKHPNKCVQELVYFQEEENFDVLQDAPFREKSFFIEELPPTLAFCNWDLTQMGKGIQSSIVICPESFLSSYLSFWNTIVNHEYIHAEDDFYGIYLFDGGKIDYSNIDEIPTLIHDTRRFHDRGFNPKADIFEARAYNNEIKNTQCGTLKGLKRDLRLIKEQTIDYLNEFKILYQEEVESSDNKKLSLLGRVSYTLVKDIESTLIM